MKHRPRPPEQADLLRPRLLDMFDGRHELVRLAALIDWSWFEREWAGFFPAGGDCQLVEVEAEFVRRAAGLAAHAAV